MMFINNFDNKKILIWGYGLEGRSALKLLINNCNCKSITIATKNKVDEKIDKINFILENDILKYNYDIVIKSSGVSAYKKEILELKKEGVIITSNLNILLSEISKYKNIKTIGITGTKGKSTTSSMFYHILKENNYKVAFAGNIGISFLDLIENLSYYDYIILELSSYQCQGLQEKLDYCIVLNLFPEHIDWHITHCNYFDDKLNIIRYSKNQILNYKTEEIKNFIKNNSNIEYNLKYFNYKLGFMVINGFIKHRQDKIINIEKFDNIIGEHIFTNLCAILTILKIENIDINNSLESLKNFKTLNHRLEIVYNNKETNTVFVDDSISTIPESTIESIKAFSNYKKIFLILGGFDRKQDYSNLVSKIKENDNIKKIFLLGQTGLRLANEFKTSKYFFSLNDIILDIFESNINDTAILLSPASPSYDMFKNFEERGDLFRNLIKERQKY